MADIVHRIGVEASPPEKVYDALTTLDGLSGWRTPPGRQPGSGVAAVQEVGGDGEEQGRPDAQHPEALPR